MEIPGPKWKDECRHKPDEYVGTVEVLSRNPDKSIREDAYDVYVYPSGHGHGDDVRMRYGNKGYEYISVGPLANLVAHVNGISQIDYYQAAYRLLQDKGRIVVSWVRNPGPET